MKELTKEDLEDLLLGCAVLGCGGGGGLEWGTRTVLKELEEGRRFVLAGPDDLPEDGWVASPYFCGSLAPGVPVREDLPKVEDFPPLRAFRALEDRVGGRFCGVVATELGGGNTAVALTVAARLGISTLDGDPAGRAVPELTQSTLHLRGNPITPFALADRFGDVIVVEEVADASQAEAIARALARTSGGLIGVADFPAQVKDVSPLLIWSTLSQALAIGRAGREALEMGEDPATAMARAGGGCVRFRGVLSEEPRWRDDGGFTIGEFVLTGVGRWSNSRYRVWFKNENMISWLDGEVDLTCPDLICPVDESGRPVHNPRIPHGVTLTVLAFPAPSPWRTEEGLALLGPEHFGFEVPYRPLTADGASDEASFRDEP